MLQSRQFIFQGVLFYGKCIELTMLSTSYCIPVCQAEFADHLKLLGNWGCNCSDMVGVIGLIHWPMLRSHYNREFELQRNDGTDTSLYFPDFIEVIRHKSAVYNSD